MSEYEGECPFDTLLARTPYLVVPKMALQAMPMAWRRKLADLLDEARAAGLETPSYIVLRSAINDDPDGCAISDERTGFVRIIRKPLDPWANYRHAGVADVQALAPRFKASS